MKGADLPDPRAFRIGFRQVVGDAFALRGLEVTVDGALVEDGAGVALRVPGRPDLLRLKPLGRKVQWDPKGDRERPATEPERTAHARLVEAMKGVASGPHRVRIVGPLEEGPDLDRPTLAVREFRRD